MMDVMYNIPSDSTIRKCTITKDCVLGKSEPLVEYKMRLKKAE
jgi:ATP-dependent Clp protease ATP-binding subunit ClpX